MIDICHADNKDSDSIVADKRNNVNFNKTVIGGGMTLAIIVTLLINIISIGVMTYIVDTRISRVEKDLTNYKEQVEKKFIDTSYIISDLCVK